MPKSIETQMEALIFGLYLALTAPTDEKAQEAAALAEEVAVGMTEAEVDYAKDQALDLYEEAKDA